MDLVTTEEMKELLTSPIIKETKPMTNGMINQQALDSGIQRHHIKCLVFHYHLETLQSMLSLFSLQYLSIIGTIQKVLGTNTLK